MIILIPPEAEEWGDDAHEWIDHVTDDQIRAAYVEAGLGADYADVVIEVLRGRYEGPPLE